MKRTLSLLLGTLLFSTLQAQVYEWFDEAGTRHFSDKKPEGVAFRELGDPAANLSSYRATEIRRPLPSADEGRTGASPSARNRRTARRELEAACEEYLSRIDALHDRLRSGYDEPTGNRLRAERSALRAAYLRDCN